MGRVNVITQKKSLSLVGSFCKSPFTWITPDVNNELQPVVWFWNGRGPTPHWTILGQSEQKDLPLHKLFTWIADLLILGFYLGCDSKRGEDPPLSYKCGQSGNKDLPVYIYFTGMAKLLISSSCLCVDSKRGRDPALTDQGVSVNKNNRIFQYAQLYLPSEDCRYWYWLTRKK